MQQVRQETAGETDRARLAGGDPKRFIRSIDTLPTLPSVVAKIGELVENPAASAADINKVIRQDIALSARILKLVNSSFYGFPRRIGSVTHAVVILGFNTVRNVALSAFVVDAFAGRDLPFGYREFWIHSLGVGVAATALAERRALARAEDAFLGGLLHDVGKIVLHSYARAEYAAVLRRVDERDCLLVDAERELLGMTHADVGSLLLDAWHIPSHLVEVVKLHHEPEKATADPELAAVVHLADILTRALLVGDGGDGRVPRASHEAWRRLGLELGEMGGICRRIAGEMRKVDAFVELL
jgi:HD-like signal output (HDOD) protein